MEKKHTDFGEEKREQRENKEKEEKNRKHAQRLKKERERRKRKGKYVKNREKREKIDYPVLLSTLSLKLRSKKLLERRLSFLKNADMICKV